MWIDVHAHLDKLEEGPDKAIEKAIASGVSRIITIGTEPSDHPFIVEAVTKWSPYVYGTLGVHPHEAILWNADVKRYIEEHISNSRIVAVGEIGLDYYYKHSDPEVQKKTFREQIELAIECNMPVEIHTRDAEIDTVEILKDYAGHLRGLIHCFTGTQFLADEAVKMGFHFSISGVLTFKNAETLRTIVRSIPDENLHIETDAPFLAPIPHRGQQNTPAYMIHTAEKLAEIKGLTLEQLNAQVVKNIQNLFPRISMN
jgi:TatD DNase family protein